MHFSISELFLFVTTVFVSAASLEVLADERASEENERAERPIGKFTFNNPAANGLVIHI